MSNSNKKDDSPAGVFSAIALVGVLAGGYWAASEFKEYINDTKRLSEYNHDNQSSAIQKIKDKFNLGQDVEEKCRKAAEEQAKLQDGGGAQAFELSCLRKEAGLSEPTNEM